MRRFVTCLVLPACLWAGPIVQADVEYDLLLQEFEQAQQQWFQQLREAEVSKRPPHPAKDFPPRFRRYAEEHAGRSEAIPALGWIVGAAGQISDGPGKPGADVTWALERLAKDHAADPAIKDVLRDFRYSAYYVGSEPLIALYERVIKANSDKQAQAGAMFNLAFTLFRSWGASAEDAEARGTEKKRAEKLFRKIVKEYPDTDAAKPAEGYVFEIEHLQIGMKAPEIVGSDADGKEIRLSQFRGQVVVLDFWGFW